MKTSFSCLFRWSSQDAEIPFAHSADQERATLDLIGVVQDAGKHPLGQMRDTVKLAVKTSTEVERKNVQYDSGFVLPAGKFHLKFVVRENQTGRMGSFETDLTIPDLKTQPLKMSSVILSSQIQPAKEKKGGDDPLLRDGSEVIPSVTHVFAAGQHLYLYYEVYDPSPESAGADDQGRERQWHPGLDECGFLPRKRKGLRNAVGRSNSDQCGRP